MVRTPSRKVGVKDIAEAADVAISTVSHVLNGTAPISTEVRERVLNAANALGYLSRRREKAAIAILRSVLLAVPSDTLPHNEHNLYSWTPLSALTRECERRAIRVVPMEIDIPRISGADVVAMARREQVDGILLLNDDRPELLHDIAAARIPAVLMNGEDHEMQIDSVTPGNRFAARYATNWLIDPSTSAGAICSPAITAAALARLKPPRNTARRRRKICSQAVSRSKLQSSVARKV